MRKNASIGINFLMNIILKLSTVIFPIITFPYISRVLLADGYGKVQMATAFISYFVLFSQLGIPTYGIRACAAMRDDRIKLSRTVHELISISVVMNLVAYGAFFMLLQVVPKLQEEKLLYLIISANIFLGMIGLEWLFQAMEQYTYIAVRSLVFKILSVAAMFMLVRTKEDYLIYATITVVAAVGSNVLNLTQLPKYIKLKPLGGYHISKHLRPVLTFFALSCAATIYTSLDSVMLGFMATDADVGYYSAAVKIKNILTSVVTALGAVLLPRVSYYYEQGKIVEFRAIIKKAMSFVLLLSLPLSVYFVLFAKNGIYFLSGEAYEQSVFPMQIIMPTVVLIGITNVLGMQVLVPTGREKYVLYSTIVGALTDLVANLILIPHFQAAGAALGTLIAELLVLVVQVWVLRREIVSFAGNVKWVRIAIALIGAVSTSGWMILLPWSDFWILALSAIVFFGVYVLLLFLMKEPFVREMEQKGFAKLNRIILRREE